MTSADEDGAAKSAARQKLFEDASTFGSISDEDSVGQIRAEGDQFINRYCGAAAIEKKMYAFT